LEYLEKILQDLQIAGKTGYLEHINRMCRQMFSAEISVDELGFINGLAKGAYVFEWVEIQKFNSRPLFKLSVQAQKTASEKERGQRTKRILNAEILEEMNKAMKGRVQRFRKALEIEAQKQERILLKEAHGDSKKVFEQYATLEMTVLPSKPIPVRPDLKKSQQQVASPSLNFRPLSTQ
jgi:hypothetical protein